jgi:hypothetical protein
MGELYGLVLLAGPAILAWQGYSWLRTGIWTALPISKTFAYFELPVPSTNWLGLQRIIDWIFDIPSSLAVFVLSFIVVIICALVEALYDNYEANRARRSAQ